MASYSLSFVLFIVLLHFSPCIFATAEAQPEWNPFFLRWYSSIADGSSEAEEIFTLLPGLLEAKIDFSIIPVTTKKLPQHDKLQRGILSSFLYPGTSKRLFQPVPPNLTPLERMRYMSNTPPHPISINVVSVHSPTELPSISLQSAHINIVRFRTSLDNLEPTAKELSFLKGYDQIWVTSRRMKDLLRNVDVPIVVIPSPVNTNVWSYYEDDLNEDPTAPSVYLPRSSFRILNPVDLTSPDWWILPYRFLKLKTQFSDGAILVMLIQKMPRPDMTEIELGFFFQDHFADLIKTPNTLRLKISEDGSYAENLPQSLPDTVHVIRADNITAGQLIYLYRNCHLFGSTSFTDSYENDVLRAMATELPVVAYQLGSLRDTLNSSNALLLPHVDPARKRPEFEHTLLSSLLLDSMQSSSTNKLRTLGIRARETAVQRHSSEKVAQVMLRHIQQLLSGLAPNASPRQPIRTGPLLPKPAPPPPPKRTRIIPPLQQQ